MSNVEELPSMKEIEELVEASQNKDAPVLGEEANVEWKEDEVQAGSLLGFSGEGVLSEDEALTDLESKMKELRTLEKEILTMR